MSSSTSVSPSPPARASVRAGPDGHGSRWRSATRRWSSGSSGSGLCYLELADAVRSDVRREHLFLDPVGMLEQVGVRSGQREPYAVGELEPCLLAQRVDTVDQLVHAALATQLVVELRRHRNRDGFVGGERPALPCAPFDEHLLRAELVPVHADAAAPELLELAGFERGTDGAELLAELRPEQREVRLDADVHRLDRRELDGLDAQLLGDLFRVAFCSRRSLDDEPAQRLPKL